MTEATTNKATVPPNDLTDEQKAYLKEAATTERQKWKIAKLQEALTDASRFISLHNHPSKRAMIEKINTVIQQSKE